MGSEKVKGRWDWLRSRAEKSGTMTSSEVRARLTGLRLRSRVDTVREDRGTEPTIVDAIYALVEAVDRLGKVVSESIDLIGVP